MYLSSHSVQFVFDRTDDCHYTHSLLKLGPEAFLWFELKQHQLADLVLSVTCRKGIPQLRIFDTASATLLSQQTNHWIFAPQPVITEEVLRSQSISPSIRKLPDGFLPWLAKCAAINKHRKIALLVSCDAVEPLMQTGSLEDLPPNCITLLRFPADADSLTELLLSSPSLADFFPQIRQALERSRMPLMPALRLTMDEQMICFHDRAQDIQNMLLLHAIRDASITDSVEQLCDQAQYLYLLRKYRRLYLLGDRFPDNPAYLPTLSVMEQQLPEYHAAVRTRTSELRRSYPDIPIDKALQLEQLIPAGSLTDSCFDSDHTIVFSGALTNSLYRLQKSLRSGKVPPEVLNTADTSMFPDLYTLWNKPRSSMILKAADLFCDCAHDAIKHERWYALTLSLYMLRFCSSQVCAGPEQNENLKKVLTLGEDVIHKANHIASSSWINGMLSGIKPPSSSGISNIAEYTQMIHDAAFREDLNQDQIELLTKRLLLEETVNTFYRQEISPAQQTDTLLQLQQIYEQSLSKAKQKSKPAAEAPIPKAAGVPAAAPASHETTFEDDLRITRQLLYRNHMPGGVPCPEDEDDYDEDLVVEDVT